MKTGEIESGTFFFLCFLLSNLILAEDDGKSDGGGPLKE